MHRLRLAVLAASLAVAWALPPSAQAHGTGHRVLGAETAVGALYFHYSSGEPMAWCKVEVFSPQDVQTAFQSARTDAQGRFAFVPDAPGAWRVTAFDGEGHKSVAEMLIALEETPEPNTPGALRRDDARDRNPDPPVTRALLGASLILNLFTGASLLMRKKGGR